MWVCECIYCGRQSVVSGTNLKSGHTKSCTCITGSTGEFIIRNTLKANHIHFCEQYSFNDFRFENGGIPKFDFAIFDKNEKLIAVLEFDGEQHYVATGGWNNPELQSATKIRDVQKTLYCEQHNIPLVRIPYYELNKINILYLLQKINTKINEMRGNE